MTLLKKEQQESNENAKLCYICQKKKLKKYLKDKNTVMLDIILIVLGSIEPCA